MTKIDKEKPHSKIHRDLAKHTGGLWLCELNVITSMYKDGYPFNRIAETVCRDSCYVFAVIKRLIEKGELNERVKLRDRKKRIAGIGMGVAC
ncbi:hypothetical protein P255_02962 [Acinetobacter brisouii CIP 110357]|uniref:Uncharacterized protein n=1 Tax=Acinetobacter brisouii CIP 110357 TaxID=1341683 RepID=V2UFL1_9GAMM|nr:hypothetical protein [Acinetobacter brisouii]ENV46205.1 hypothetical protein F954_02840 [Acinetobacter brisouii ANC 4119]ESK47480.1 hypothetical protein P255_02962 [Acinetobacter brisouii CIP 110357]